MPPLRLSLFSTHKIEVWQIKDNSRSRRIAHCSWRLPRWAKPPTVLLLLVWNTQMKPGGKELNPEDIITEVRIKSEMPKPVVSEPLEYAEDFADIASRLVAAGFSEEDLGYIFAVPKWKIQSWKEKFPLFKMACTEGKVVESKKLVAKGLLAAVGYETKTSKRKITRDENGNVSKDEETIFTNHVPPNHNLLMFILCNISRQLGNNNWKSKNILEVEAKSLNVQITGELASDQIRKLAGRILGEPTKIIDAQFELKTVNE